MTTILNFSHELTPKVLDEIYNRPDVAGTALKQEMISCQIDFDKPLLEQFDTLYPGVSRKFSFGTEILYVPPALSFTSAYVTTQLTSWYRVKMIVLKPTPGPIRQYVLADIIRLYEL